MLEELICAVSHVPIEKNEIVETLSQLGIKELKEDEEVKEFHHLRKLHENNAFFTVTLKAVEKHQIERNQGQNSKRNK